MIQRNLIPKDGIFNVTPELQEASYHIFRELFPPKKAFLHKKEVEFSKRMAGINMMKLDLSRSETLPVTKQKTSSPITCGIVYLISNKSFPGTFKVGMTQNLENRLSQYQTYDPFRRFKVEHYKFVSDRRLEEKEFWIYFPWILRVGNGLITKRLKKCSARRQTIFLTMLRLRSK